MKTKLLFPVLILAVLTGCSVYNALVNISKLKFKLASVNNFQVGSIALENKSSLKDFNALDIINLTAAAASGSLPVSFTLNVEAKNPNESAGNTQATDVSLKSFPWKLVIDGKETISGNISEPVVVPGGGGTSNIPLQLNLNLIEFFGNEGFENIVNLALKLGGKGGSTANLELIAEPVLGTPIGDITYPGPLTIIDKEFN